MTKLIAEYKVKHTGTVVATTQEFGTVEDAVDYVHSRAKNYIVDDINTYYNELTHHGQCEILVVVESKLLERSYYILSG